MSEGVQEQKQQAMAENNTEKRSKAVDLDLAVKRHITAGGDVTVRGDTQMEGSVVIRGWLEAKHLKGACKGLFLDYESLKKKYYSPEPGWWAMTVNEDGVTARVYVSHHGDWKATDITDIKIDTAPEYVLGEFNRLQNEFLQILDKEVVSVKVTDAGGDPARRAICIGFADGSEIHGELPLAGISTTGLVTGADYTRFEYGYQASRQAPHNLWIEGNETGNTHCVLAGHVRGKDGELEKRIFCEIPDASNALSGFISREDYQRFNKGVDDLTALEDNKGKPNGIVVLDRDGRIPANYIPGTIEEVLEFASFESEVELTDGKSGKKSTDDGCMVIYDEDRDTFLLAVIKQNQTSTDWDLVLRPNKVVKSYDVSNDNEIVPDGSDGITDKIPDVGIELGGEKYPDIWGNGGNNWHLTLKAFDIYADWEDGERYGTESANGRVPRPSRLFLCSSRNNVWGWSGKQLVNMGNPVTIGRDSGTAFPGDAGATLEEKVKALQEQLTTMGGYTRDEILQVCQSVFGEIFSNEEISNE